MANMIGDLAVLLSRQAIGEETILEEAEDAPVGCESGNEYDGRISLRISAVFVILIASSLGAWFPVFAARHKKTGVPSWAFFIAKYFGSGVIVATAFIHLMAPAHEALSNPCLTGPITEYPWVEGITLMSIFILFFTELMAMRYVTFGQGRNDSFESLQKPAASSGVPHTLGEDHLGHSRDHDVESSWRMKEDYALQMTAVFILEFGVIFHSIFIGLTLAVAGEEFIILYVVLVFHQTFEGLGLGSRLATAPWPKSNRWTPYVLAFSYGLSTPIAIAIGLGLRETYSPGSQAALLVNGIFDSISAGILIYTGLVELMAHEFMFSHVMRTAKLNVVLGAFATMSMGAGQSTAASSVTTFMCNAELTLGLMALLGKWA